VGRNEYIDQKHDRFRKIKAAGRFWGLLDWNRFSFLRSAANILSVCLGDAFDKFDTEHRPTVECLSATMTGCYDSPSSCARVWP